MTEASIPKKRTTFYIEPNSLKAFKGICFREDESMSEKVERWIQEYNERHREGNPQLILTGFQGEKKRKCGLCHQESAMLWLVSYKSGKSIPSCKSCVEKRKEQGLVRRVIKLL